MSHIWGGIFIMGGGVFTVATTDMTILKLLFIVLGIIMTLLFINAYFIRKTELMRILNKLKEEGEDLK
ncbi:MAG: hypothetical protein PHC64_03680 [Candidatus Gastranaerophilales bacterium]|nr:hypothetical protein [Candidatus Gastranaerophilales bacterium]